jgi:hypothetical protein
MKNKCSYLGDTLWYTPRQFFKFFFLLRHLLTRTDDITTKITIIVSSTAISIVSRSWNWKLFLWFISNNKFYFSHLIIKILCLSLIFLTSTYMTFLCLLMMVCISLFYKIWKLKIINVDIIILFGFYLNSDLLTLRWIDLSNQFTMSWTCDDFCRSNQK